MGHLMNPCGCSELEIVEAFDSFDHFDGASGEIERMVQSGKLRDVPVERPMALGAFKERWLRCSCGAIWRFVTPDFPFKGVLRPVDAGE